MIGVIAWVGRPRRDARRSKMRRGEGSRSGGRRKEKRAAAEERRNSAAEMRDAALVSGGYLVGTMFAAAVGKGQWRAGELVGSWS